MTLVERAHEIAKKAHEGQVDSQKNRIVKKRIKCSIKNQKKIMDSRTCLYRHLVPSFPRTKIS